MGSVFQIKFLLVLCLFPVSFFIVNCQGLTLGIERDFDVEERLLSKVRGRLDLRRSVIMDVRPRFQFEMSRLPRSFHAYWKDWSLMGFTKKRLTQRKNNLQRLLALNGIDPLTRVVILGQGLEGRGRSFYLQPLY